MNFNNFGEIACSDGDFECRQDISRNTKREDYYWCFDHRFNGFKRKHETEKAILFQDTERYFWVPRSLLMERDGTLCIWCGFKPKFISMAR